MTILRPHPFRKRQRRTLVALVRATLPPGQSLNLPVDPEDLDKRVGLTMASMAWDGRLAVGLGLRLIEWMAVFRHGRPLSSLSQERAEQWVLAWAESRWATIRLWARVLLTVVKPAHFARRDVQRQVGHPAGHLDAVRPKKTITLPPKQVINRLDRNRKIRTQVVVIGTGAGGAVVAAELAQAGIDVVMVEAGRVFDAEEMGRDPAWALREMYQDGGTTIALGSPSIPIPLGKTVGGTTTINSGTCFRLPERVLKKWESLGLPIDRDALNRHFSHVETRISVKPVPPSLLGGSSAVIARGAEAMGLSHGPLSRNIDGCEQSGVCAFGCPRNAKQSMNITYVPDALHAGATLYSRTRATQVLKKGGRAVGILAQNGNHTLEINADAVVSSCGAITGVPFLQQAGIRSRHLGRHLSIHPGTKIVAVMPEDVDGWADTPQGYGIYDFAEDGLMFEGAFVPPEYTAIALPFVGRKFTEVMENYRRLAVFGFLVSDAPSGRVWRGVGGKPIISYWMPKSDLERVRLGLRTLSKVFFAAGATRIYLPVAHAEEQLSLESALNALDAPLDPLGLEMAAFHPLGTARMATSKRDGVIRPDLETWEIPGLHVVDGSIFPSSLGVNPQLSIMAYATAAAENIASQFGK